MLVLTRKTDERIMIDRGRIVVTVVRVQGEKVRLGIEAPAGVEIHREEIFIQAEAERNKPPQ